jgi:hypothetical protein
MPALSITIFGMTNHTQHSTTSITTLFSLVQNAECQYAKCRFAECRGAIAFALKLVSIEDDFLIFSYFPVGQVLHLKHILYETTSFGRKYVGQMSVGQM